MYGETMKFKNVYKHVYMANEMC